MKETPWTSNRFRRSTIVLGCFVSGLSDALVLSEQT